MSDEFTPDLGELMARSLEAAPEILPFLPRLFSDLEDLGARSDEVVSVLREAGLPTGLSVLDLGCGKGAVAIALARAFGAMVRGVDGMPAFVEHASGRARTAGVDDRCTFTVGDVRHTVATERGCDMVCMLALGDLFGTARETVGVLRQCVLPGGYILIDDAYLTDGTRPVEDLENCFDHATTVEMLTAHGDELIAERVVDGPEARGLYEAMTDSIARRAEELAALEPAAAELVLDYAKRQRDEVDLLCGPVVGALWLLRVC